MNLNNLLNEDTTYDSYTKDIVGYIGSKLNGIGIENDNIEVLIGDDEVQDYSKLPVGVIILGNSSYENSFTGSYKRGREVVVKSTSILVGIATLGFQSVFVLEDAFVEQFDEQMFTTSKGNSAEIRFNGSNYLTFKGKTVNTNKSYKERHSLKAVTFEMEFRHSVFNNKEKQMIDPEDIGIESVEAILREGEINE